MRTAVTSARKKKTVGTQSPWAKRPAIKRGGGNGCTIIFSYCFSSPPLNPGEARVRSRKFPHTPPYDLHADGNIDALRRTQARRRYVVDEFFFFFSGSSRRMEDVRASGLQTRLKTSFASRATRRDCTRFRIGKPHFPASMHLATCSIELYSFIQREDTDIESVMKNQTNRK